MSGTYLTWLADELRAAGLTVVEYSGWQTRARGSGGYSSGRPYCIMWHHTASPASTSAKSDADYMCVSSANSNKPTANLMLARDASVWVLAAGATNTNGKGRARTFSRGNVPQDSMNTYAVGIEACNDGLGEPWSQAMIDAYFLTSITICKALGLGPRDIESHYDYAPDRKIDPATCKAVQGPWCPGSIGNSYDTWDVESMRDEHERRWNDSEGDKGMALSDDDIKRIADAVRGVLNEGATPGTGADPAFPGQPWAETNVNTARTVQDLVNSTNGIAAGVTQLLADG